VAEDGYEEQIVIPNEKREMAASEGIGTENKDQVAVQITYISVTVIALRKSVLTSKTFNCLIN